MWQKLPQRWFSSEDVKIDCLRIMALNPKLNIYVVTLNPKDKDSHPTFRDLFRYKFLKDTSIADTDIQNYFFQEFLNTVGKSEFRKDKDSKKVIGVSEYNEEKGTCSLNILHERDVIEGIIDGGQYGILRAYADVDCKEEKTSLGTNLAVLDKFYICLCTPLNSAYGFLLVQSYTEISVQDPIKNFIVDLLKFEDKFYNVNIEPFVPQKFVDKFKAESKIRMFTYRSKVGISKIMRDDKLLLKGQSFEVEITIKPIEQDFLPGTEVAEALVEKLANKKFDRVALGDYKEQSVYIQDGKERKAHYDVKKEIQSIRPTIYLVDEGVSVNETTGQPDFGQIKDYCLALLDEIKKEYNSNEDIDEL